MRYISKPNPVRPLPHRVALLLGAVVLGGCTTGLKIKSHPDAEAHVVVLGGIAGQLAPGRKFIKVLNQNRYDLGQTISAQPFDWHKIRNPDGPAIQIVAMPGDPYNETRAKQLADALLEWRENNQTRGKEQDIYLVAGSAGDEIAQMACDHLPRSFFKRVVFLSAWNLLADADLTNVKQACSAGVYNYHSREDRKWGIDSQAAGRVGLGDADVWQLRWWKAASKKYKKYDNEGQCLDCYAPKFRDTFLIPLFRSDGKLEGEAATRWKKGETHGSP